MNPWDADERHSRCSPAPRVSVRRARRTDRETFAPYRAGWSYRRRRRSDWLSLVLPPYIGHFPTGIGRDGQQRQAQIADLQQHAEERALVLQLTRQQRPARRLARDGQRIEPRCIAIGPAALDANMIGRHRRPSAWERTLGKFGQYCNPLSS